MADKRLGKGLEALITSYSTDEKKGQLDGALPIDVIAPNRNQPRQEFDDVKMQELIASIRENGILQPLTVRESTTGSFELIAGERRLRAAKEAGLETVPVYILSVDADVEMMEYALVENVQRVDLNPIEEAEGYAILSGKYDLSQEDIAKKVGKSRPAIANKLRLLKLPPEIKAGLKSGDISNGHAKALLGLRKSLQMITLFHKIVKEGLNVRQTESLVQALGISSDRKTAVKKVIPLSPEIQQVETSLRELFQTRVKLQKSKTGKGKIQIDFSSEEDLERILEILKLN
ncbi:MAG: ParB/RepB/Spo0J family partition protein [Candidatus Marinimicrobia bacterium]|jgi:ParB family chromosome partitioning protein|nr:ParB/RepB/Spo0J family partition protein [Candidatus Neomarinimicrobiota bacterium]MDP6853183.1 ParB/RepB/Spo0J family partition protein [Candidatus Neomarinimicrobiota bacterium]